ncbi:MAG: TonB-dependent receptor [Halieaceae bacterium]|jgi:outer membrane receptor protein involved in Fe transport|nr:TonB-dependent receptor [Halieaceae bacterium]
MGKWEQAILVSMAAISLAHADPQMEEITVSAQRNLLGQDLFVPNNVQSIADNEQVSLNRSIADWIERLPGVSFNGQGGLKQSYSVRGFSRWRIRTEVDGVPIITDRRAGSSASFIPPDLLEQATVQRGPGSTLYGSGAMGGVIGLSTTRPMELRVSVASQSDDRQSSATVAMGEKDRYGVVMSYRHANRAHDGQGNALNTGFEQVAGLAKYQKNFGGKQLSLSWLPSYGSNIGKSSATYPQQQITEYPEELHSIARLQLVGDDQWLLRFYHHYQNWETLTERVDERSNLTTYRAHTFGGLFYQSLDYLSGLGRWGVEWVGRRDVSVEDKERDAGGIKRFDRQPIDGDQDTIAVFVNQQWNFDRAQLSGGLRYDHINQSQEGDSRRDSRLNLSAAGLWSLNDRWTLNAELGTGFRFPSLTELYFDGVTPRGTTLGNPDLDPEENRAVQIGVEYKTDGLSFAANTYYNDLENYIERYRVSDDLISYRNLDDAEIEGFEVDLTWQPTGTWTHELSYQWQRGKDSHGNWLADLNPPSWRYMLLWQGNTVGLRSDLSYREAQSDFGEGEQSLPSALIWNASIQSDWGKAWRVSAYVNNILDRQYLGSADENAPFQPGRIVGVRLQWAP